MRTAWQARSGADLRSRPPGGALSVLYAEYSSMRPKITAMAAGATRVAMTAPPRAPSVVATSRNMPMRMLDTVPHVGRGRAGAGGDDRNERSADGVADVHAQDDGEERNDDDAAARPVSDPRKPAAADPPTSMADSAHVLMMRSPRRAYPARGTDAIHRPFMLPCARGLRCWTLTSRAWTRHRPRSMSLPFSPR